MKKVKNTDWQDTAMLEAVVVTKRYGYKLSRISFLFSLIALIITYQIPYLYFFFYFIYSLILNKTFIMIPALWVNIIFILLSILITTGFIVSLVLGIISIVKGKRGLSLHVNTRKTYRFGRDSIILGTTSMVCLTTYIIVFVLMYLNY